MPRKPRTHLLREKGASGMLVALCGWPSGEAARFTRDPEQADCKRCLAEFHERSPGFLPHAELDDWVPPPPREVTRQEWELEGRHALADSERGRGPERFAFYRVEDALEALRVHQLDGHGAKSASLEKREGATTSRRPRLSHLDRVADVVHVRRALQAAYRHRPYRREPPNWYGVSAADCEAILMANLVGTEEVTEVSRRRKPGESGPRTRADRVLVPRSVEWLCAEYALEARVIAGVLKVGRSRMRVALAVLRMMPDPVRSPVEMKAVLTLRAAKERRAA